MSQSHSSLPAGLTADVFRPSTVTEFKEIKPDYKLLYASRSVVSLISLSTDAKSQSTKPLKICGPIQKPKNFFQRVFSKKLSLQEKNIKEFKAQFIILLDKFKNWGEIHACNTKSICDNIELMKTRIFDESYTGCQTNEFFEILKLSLENIYFQLNNTNISELKRKKEFQQLCIQFDKCAPGVFSHCEDAYFELSARPSIVHWIAEIRTNQIKSYIEEYISDYAISDDNKVHVYNAFYRYAKNEGMFPLTTVDKIVDSFIQTSTGIDDSALTVFHNELFKRLTPQFILDGITANVSSEFNLILNESKNSSGWFTYDQKIINRCDALLKNAGCEMPVTYFELDSENKTARFSPVLFQLTFLKFCLDKKFLLLHSDWQRIELAANYFVVVNTADYKTGIELAWLENKEGNQVLWSDLTEKIQGRCLGALHNKGQEGELDKKEDYRLSKLPKRILHAMNAKETHLLVSIITTPTMLEGFLSELSGNVLYNKYDIRYYSTTINLHKYTAQHDKLELFTYLMCLDSRDKDELLKFAVDNRRTEIAKLLVNSFHADPFKSYGFEHGFERSPYDIAKATLQAELVDIFLRRQMNHSFIHVHGFFQGSITIIMENNEMPTIDISNHLNELEDKERCSDALSSIIKLKTIVSKNQWEIIENKMVFKLAGLSGIDTKANLACI